MQRKYNFIYEKLVKAEYDIVGHIAYSLYKQQKIQHIEEFKKANGDKSPTDDELVSFNNFSSLAHSIETYRLKAEMILQGFVDNVLEETIKEVETDCKQNQAEILEDIIRPILPPTKTRAFFGGVVQNIVAAFAVSLILALLILILQAQDKGVKNVIEDTFSVDITPKSGADQINDSLKIKDSTKINSKDSIVSPK